MINIDNIASPEEVLSAALEEDIEHVLVVARSPDGELTVWTNAVGRDLRPLVSYAVDHLT